MPKCRICGDVKKHENMVQVEPRLYVCIECEEKYLEKNKVKNLKSDRDLLVDYIREIYGEDIKIYHMKQVKDLHEKFNLKYSGMFLTLKYIFETLNIKTNKSYGIMLILNYYEEARDYYIFKKDNENLGYEDFLKVKNNSTVEKFHYNSGIYKLINTNTNKEYIGQTFDFDRRKKEHFDSLANNNHFNKELQDDYNNGDIFEFKIMERLYIPHDALGKAYLLKKEEQYIGDISNKYNDEYSFTKVLDLRDVVSNGFGIMESYNACRLVQIYDKEAFNMEKIDYFKLEGIEEI